MIRRFAFRRLTRKVRGAAHAQHTPIAAESLGDDGRAEGRCDGAAARWLLTVSLDPGDHIGLCCDRVDDRGRARPHDLRVHARSERLL